MDGKIIKAGLTAKLLGVIFDEELRWKSMCSRPPPQPWDSADYGTYGQPK